MRDSLFEQLRSSSRELADVLAPLPTAPVALACREIFACDAPTASERFGLQSPYKQAHYILAMLATSPEPDTSTQDELSAKADFERRWQRTLELVRQVFDTYAQMYWPEKPEDWAGRDDATHERHGFAMRAFLHQHMTGWLADMSQVLSRVRKVLGPFDAELEARAGISATAAADVCEWLYDGMQRQLDRESALIVRLKEIYDDGVAKRSPPQELLERAKSDPQILELSAIETIGRDPFTIDRGALERAFGKKASRAFWRLFTTRRGTVSLPLGVDEPNPVENAPLLTLTDNEAILPAVNPLPRAIWVRLSSALDTPELRGRFASCRGRVHEENVARVIQQFVGTADEVWRGAYEQPDAQFEHDLVLLAGRVLLVIESKAAPLDSVFRDPERAVTRLRRQFRADEGIQSGVDQAERIRRRLVEQRGTVSLYDRHGALLREITPGEVDEVLCFCVTADDYGVLATDLSLFLERADEQPYPWVVNAYDLETFLGALRKRHWGVDRLIQYVRERRRLHGKVFTTDELEIAGVFIRHGTLKDLIEADAEIVQLGSDLSSVFDEIFMEDHGGPPAVLDPPGPIVWTDLRRALKVAAHESGLPAARPITRTSKGAVGAPRVGRNAPCPCGSGIKYKRCHGR
jgi:hypothetical protein